jgi:TRAP-type mannitol/chloroaromatic compound transport system substrate-binding protein
MDRRDFLKTTSAAAASVAAGATAGEDAVSTASAQASAHSQAPAVQLGALRVVMASSWAADAPGFSAQRLAHRIATVSGGRIAVELLSAADSHAAVDLTFGSAHEHARHHPAFAFFAGLPGSQGLDAAGLSAWLAVGGGQMLWDELAAGFGFKPLLAGHTGPSAGLWSNRALEATSDLAGAKVFAAGLAGDVLRTLGAEVVDVPIDTLGAALAGGRVDAAEWLGPVAAVAPDLRPLADRIYTGAGVMLSGSATVMTVRRPLWDRMDPAQQAILETCAAAEYQATLAELLAHAPFDRHARHQARQLALAREIAGAIERASRDAVERLAATDAVSQRVAGSYQAFRNYMSGEPAGATS